MTQPSPEARFEEATAHFDRRDFKKAVELYQDLLSTYPHHVPAAVNLALAFTELGDFDAARLVLEPLAVREPRNARVWVGLGNLFFKKGDFPAAAGAYAKAHESDPTLISPLTNLGAIAHAMGQHDQAIGWFAKGLSLDPQQAPLYRHIGLMFQEKGDLVSAHRSYAQALKLKPQNWLWQLQKATLCPSLMSSTDEIEQWWNQTLGTLEKISQAPAQPVGFSELLESNAYPPFFTAYHEKPVREFRKIYADLIRRGLGEIPAPSKKSGKPQVGFVVTRGHESIFLNLMGGMFAKWSDSFERVIFYEAAGHEKLKKGLKPENARLVTLFGSGEAVLDQIRTTSCDLLYYWEVGTDALNYFLPFLKLAPVQCTSWGFPVTSGMSEVNDFISTQWLQASESENDYTENLIRLKGLPCYYRSPVLGQTKSRRDLGLPEGKRLYLCPQNLFKFHPDFDAMLAQILARDSQGVLVLLAGTIPWVQQALTSRLEKVIPDSAKRILFLPRLSRDDYLSLLAAGDVMLDSVWYGGGATTAEGLSLGTPVVTYPSRYLSGQMTLAFYNKMGLRDLVASSPDDYVNMALKVACEPDWKQELVMRIRDREGALFEDESSARELENHFLKVIEASRR